MTDRETLRQTLAELLEAEQGTKPPPLTDDQNLRESLGLDSVDVVSLVMQIECRYKIRLGHEELGKVATVGDMLDLLQAKTAEAPATAAA
jgi:acyl carrier protein